MRLLLLALSLLSVGSVVAATYSTKSVDHYAAYANVVSRSFSEGETGDSSGWRECVEMVNQGTEVGVICEGLRTITVHGGKSVEVNYYCEFRFSHFENSKYRIELEECQ